MGSIRVYMTTAAEGREDAVSVVESWLEEFSGREFYDGFEIDEEDVKIVRDMPLDFFGDARERCKQRVERYEQDLSRWRQEGNAGMAGFCHISIGEMLMQFFCRDMPFYNLVTQDWMPPALDEWAVMACLYF